MKPENEIKASDYFADSEIIVEAGVIKTEEQLESLTADTLKPMGGRLSVQPLYEDEDGNPIGPAMSDKGRIESHEAIVLNVSGDLDLTKYPKGFGIGSTVYFSVMAGAIITGMKWARFVNDVNIIGVMTAEGIKTTFDRLLMKEVQCDDVDKMDTSDIPALRYEVLSVGPDVVDIEVGDFVYTGYYEGQELNNNRTGECYKTCFQRDIFGKEVK